MTEKNNDQPADKKTLTLKRVNVEQSTVKQNFRHGRSKAVVVETKRRKIIRPDEAQEAPKERLTKPRVVTVTKKTTEDLVAKKEAKTSAPKSTAKNASGLSSTEMGARIRALQEAKIRSEQEEAERLKEEERRQAEQRAREAQEKEEQEP